MSRSITILALAFAGLVVAASAQTTAPSAPAAPTAAAPATTAPGGGASKSEPPTKCQKAQKAVVEQERLMAQRAERAGKDQQSNPKCKPGEACAGGGHLQAAYERGRKSDEAKLTRLKADAEKLCKAG